jgi:hypothetical protein
MGAGWAMSVGKKIRTLTASNATKKIRTINKGAIYCRKKAMVGSAVLRGISILKGTVSYALEMPLMNLWSKKQQILEPSVYDQRLK